MGFKMKTRHIRYDPLPHPTLSLPATKAGEGYVKIHPKIRIAQ
jgi:hypothetical protein